MGSRGDSVPQESEEILAHMLSLLGSSVEYRLLEEGFGASVHRPGRVQKALCDELAFCKSSLSGPM